MTVRGLARPVLVAAGLSAVAALTACAAPVPAAGPSGSASTPGQAAASASATPASPAARASASQVAISLTHTGAAAGLVSGYLTFTNTGSAACTLSGWPVVTAVTQSGEETKVPHATGSMLNWTYTAPEPRVRLAAGQSAYAIVSSSEATVGTATTCPPPYTRLRVALPGGAAPVTISAWLPGADTYLPSCRNIKGVPDVQISDINSAAILPRQ